MARQLAKLPSTNILHDSVPVIEFCRKLASITPPGLTKTFLCTGGGEAIEAAIKFAIRVTGRVGSPLADGRLSRHVARHDGSDRHAGLAEMASGRTALADVSADPVGGRLPSALGRGTR